MPPREEARSQDGMIRRIYEQLDVRRGKRLDDRQFAVDQAVNHRVEFETGLQLQKLPMKVGDIVLSHGNLCVLKSIGENDNCGAEGPPGHYCMRKYICWCKTCSLVRGRGHGCVSRHKFLDVPRCLRSKLTV